MLCFSISWKPSMLSGIVGFHGTGIFLVIENPLIASAPGGVTDDKNGHQKEVWLVRNLIHICNISM